MKLITISALIVLSTIMIASAGVITPGLDVKRLNRCGTLSDIDAIYYLERSISSRGTCLTVNAPGIIIDGRGFTINYSKSEIGYGIYNNGNENVLMKNLNIVQGGDYPDSHGIFIENVRSGGLLNNNITTMGGVSNAIHTLVTGHIRSHNQNIVTKGGGSYGFAIHTGDNHFINSSNIDTSRSRTAAVFIIGRDNFITDSEITLSNESRGDGILSDNARNDSDSNVTIRDRLTDRR